MGSRRATDSGPVGYPRLKVRAKRLPFRMKTEGGVELRGMGWQFAIVNCERVPTTPDEAPFFYFPFLADRAEHPKSFKISEDEGSKFSATRVAVISARRREGMLHGWRRDNF